MNKMINMENMNASLRMLDKMGEMTLHHMKETDPAAAEQLESWATCLTTRTSANSLWPAKTRRLPQSSLLTTVLQSPWSRWKH